ncbi:MAG: response regulator, partial [Cyanobacteria bacterium J06648_1]
MDKKFCQKRVKDQPLILVVDDECDNLLFASYIIESMNMSYVVTDKGERCLEIIQELMPKINLTIGMSNNFYHVEIALLADAFN